MLCYCEGKNIEINSFISVPTYFAQHRRRLEAHSQTLAFDHLEAPFSNLFMIKETKI